MEWLIKLACVLVWFVVVHFSYVLLGFAFAFFPLTHKLGLRFFAMSFFPSLCGKYCQLNCDDAKCGNWTCPNYHKEVGKCKR